MKQFLPFEKKQHFLHHLSNSCFCVPAQANQPPSSLPTTESQAVSNPTYDTYDSRQVDIDDINLGSTEEDFSEYILHFFRF